MTDLQRALGGNADRQSRLLSLQAHLTTKMNELEATIAEYRARGLVLTDAVLDGAGPARADREPLARSRT